MKQLAERYEPKRYARAVRLAGGGQVLRLPVEFLDEKGELIHTAALNVPMDLVPERVADVLETLAAETVKAQQEASARKREAAEAREKIKAAADAAVAELAGPGLAPTQ